MIRTTLEDAKGRLSDLFDAAMRGEEVLIADEDGELRVVRMVVATEGTGGPEFGSGKGLFRMADDFDDPLPVKRVAIDERCRAQQVGEGHFPDLASVPPEAITITCPVLVSAAHLICSVPERRKAEAVRDAVEGPLSESCPASLVMTHPRCSVFLDTESASLLGKS